MGIHDANEDGMHTDPLQQNNAEDIEQGDDVDQVGTLRGANATYSPEDNKLRLYVAFRLDAETYARVKAAGFSWAPKQELFVAPMWTPSRADLLTELCGEIGDEDTSLVDRAELRADRFGGYSERRAEDSARARDGVAAIADHIPLGQPILVGHHSEKHARRDAERIQNGMRRCVKMWETAQYWQRRAAGALAHAKYKELPSVRARRIKTIEADLRKQQRTRTECVEQLAAWSAEGLTLERAVWLSGGCRFSMPRKDGDRPDFQHSPSVYDALTNSCPSLYAPRELAEVVARARAVYPESIAWCDRWIAHYEMRLTYERAMLGASGYIEPPKPARRAALPLLNYDGEVRCIGLYSRGPFVTHTHPMTKAEYARIHKDYKGTRTSEDGTHRVRSAMLHNPTRSVIVFLTDAPKHPRPGQADDTPEGAAVAKRVRKGREAIAAANEARAQVQAHNREVIAAHRGEPVKRSEPAGRDDIEAIKGALRDGVQIAIAPQLFPTPVDLAQRMVALANIAPGMRVLEPSAGTGRLLDALPSGADVVAVEVMHGLAEQLRRRYPAATVITGDFLAVASSLSTKYDRILMNPPFEKAADIAHIKAAAALLAPGGRLVAICAGGPRQKDALEPLADLWEPLPDGTFEEAGTNVRTVLLTIEAP